mmetsp:Transcript_11926/g.25212  ORF Transcript_11926/g.25212 Transcript_11926/m.25212 type:complete len:484 (-) Transcript_11926:118-1569(-)
MDLAAERIESEVIFAALSIAFAKNVVGVTLLCLVTSADVIELSMAEGLPLLLESTLDLWLSSLSSSTSSRSSIVHRMDLAAERMDSDVIFAALSIAFAKNCVVGTTISQFLFVVKSDFAVEATMFSPFLSMAEAFTFKSVSALKSTSTSASSSTSTANSVCALVEGAAALVGGRGGMFLLFVKLAVVTVVAATRVLYLGVAFAFGIDLEGAEITSARRCSLSVSATRILSSPIQAAGSSVFLLLFLFLPFLNGGSAKIEFDLFLSPLASPLPLPSLDFFCFCFFFLEVFCLSLPPASTFWAWSLSLLTTVLIVQWAVTFPVVTGLSISISTSVSISIFVFFFNSRVAAIPGLLSWVSLLVSTFSLQSSWKPWEVVDNVGSPSIWETIFFVACIFVFVFAFNFAFDFAFECPMACWLLPIAFALCFSFRFLLNGKTLFNLFFLEGEADLLLITRGTAMTPLKFEEELPKVEPDVMLSPSLSSEL